MQLKYIAVAIVVGLLIGCLFVVLFSPVRPALDDGSRDRLLITELQAAGYKFELPREFFAEAIHENKTALLIHDADFSLSGLAKFKQIESELGVKSAFYIRPDAEFFTQGIKELQETEAQGWEIGFQYDCLSRSAGDRALAMKLFDAQLSYMRAFFNISSSDYHGDSFDLSINNFELYDQGLWRDAGLHEVYSLQGISYFSDTNNKLQGPDLADLGPVVVVQLHTDWTA